MYNHLSLKELKEEINDLIRDELESEASMYYFTDSAYLDRMVAELVDRTPFVILNECDLCPLSNPNMDCGGTGRDSLPF